MPAAPFENLPIAVMGIAGKSMYPGIGPDRTKGQRKSRRGIVIAGDQWRQYKGPILSVTPDISQQRSCGGDRDMLSFGKDSRMGLSPGQRPIQCIHFHRPFFRMIEDKTEDDGGSFGLFCFYLPQQIGA